MVVVQQEYANVVKAKALVNQVCYVGQQILQVLRGCNAAGDFRDGF